MCVGEVDAKDAASLEQTPEEEVKSYDNHTFNRYTAERAKGKAAATGTETPPNYHPSRLLPLGFRREH